MQDIYALDVGDFGKFGLLRHLMAGPRQLSLGVLWYATTLGTTAGDGKHLSYLDVQCKAPLRRVRQFSDCDPELFSAFHFAARGSRSIAGLERLGMLPLERTRFWSLPVKAGERRHAWFEKGLGVVGNCDSVFCDPDNGIAKAGSWLESAKSQRHVLLDELQTMSARGLGLVVYHHLGRQPGGHEAEIASWLADLRRTLSTDVVAVRFRRGTSRAFFVIDGVKAQTLCAQAKALRTAPWVRNKHMELHPRA